MIMEEVWATGIYRKLDSSVAQMGETFPFLWLDVLHMALMWCCLDGTIQTDVYHSSAGRELHDLDILRTSQCSITAMWK